IRAICGLPIPDIEQLQPAVMINVLGENMPKAITALTRHPKAHVHLYGKDEAKAKRKMGHVTFIAQEADTVLQEAKAYEEEKHDGTIYKRGNGYDLVGRKSLPCLAGSRDTCL